MEREEKSLYQVGEPYPLPGEKRMEPRMKAMLCTHLQAPYGEGALLAQQLQSSWALARSSPGLSHMFGEMAQVTCRHLEQLGALMLILSGTGREAAFRGNISGGLSEEPKVHLARALGMKNKSMQSKIRMVRRGENPQTNGVLERILLDERLHITLLQKALRELLEQV